MCLTLLCIRNVDVHVVKLPAALLLSVLLCMLRMRKGNSTCYCSDENALAIQNGSVKRERESPRPFSCYVLALVLMQMLFPPLLLFALVWVRRKAVIKDISGTKDIGV